MESLYNERTLSIMLSYKCTANCSNCGTFSSPNDTTKVEFSKVLKAIDEAEELKFESIVFTGGEATIYWEELIKGIRYASTKGFPIRLVTNAHWAINKETATNKVAELVEAGLGEINFSLGDEHLKFVSVENIYNAVNASVEHKLRNVIMYEVRENSTSSIDEIEAYIKKTNNEDKLKEFFRIVPSPWMPLNPQKKSFQKDEELLNQSNLSVRRGCDSILNTYVLQGDGKIAACCGIGMRHIEELHPVNSNEDNFLKKAIRKSENDWIKLGLRQKGPEKLLAWAAEKDPSIEWENMYSHRCQACIRLYKDEKVTNVLLENFTTQIPDLVFSLMIDRKVQSEL